MVYRLLDEFRGLFEGKTYRHRSSKLGDYVSQQLYEDLYYLGRSPKFCQRVQATRRVLNTQNRLVGVSARRGDGTFGEIIPAVDAIVDQGYAVARGRLATVEIGAETKILSKAMIKQIDRVISDLRRQVEQFRKAGGEPICVAIVGVNQASHYTSYEGDRVFTTDGSAAYRHPIQEAAAAESRLRQEAFSAFDHQSCCASEPQMKHPFASRGLMRTNSRASTAQC
ncbi:MAG: hypothetical protein HYY96_11200 [Candidatus Tectomicrobia bacterium]|nr:hypothetical protein [Candidatus Tectomicrobia bacterium]